MIATFSSAVIVATPWVGPGQSDATCCGFSFLVARWAAKDAPAIVISRYAGKGFRCRDGSPVRAAAREAGREAEPRGLRAQGAQAAARERAAPKLLHRAARPASGTRVEPPPGGRRVGGR